MIHPIRSSMPALLFGVSLFLAFFTSFASGNTEIRSFAVDSSRRGPQDLPAFARSLVKSRLHTELHRLNSARNEEAFRVVPAPLGMSLSDVCETQSGMESVVGGPGCLHELWLELDLSSEGWMRYDRFTIRLSWPAFYPTDFDIQLLSPEELLNYMNSRFHLQERGHEEDLKSPDPTAPDPPRLLFARVRLVDTGVRSPSKSKIDSSHNGAKQVQSEAVPFNIIVEPLLFGVIPETVVPTILFSIPLLVLAWFVYPRVLRYLECVASEARRELYGSQYRKSE